MQNVAQGTSSDSQNNDRTSVVHDITSSTPQSSNSSPTKSETETFSEPQPRFMTDSSESEEDSISEVTLIFESSSSLHPPSILHFLFIHTHILLCTFFFFPSFVPSLPLHPFSLRTRGGLSFASQYAFLNSLPSSGPHSFHRLNSAYIYLYTYTHTYIYPSIYLSLYIVNTYILYIRIYTYVCTYMYIRLHT